MAKSFSLLFSFIFFFFFMPSLVTSLSFNFTTFDQSVRTGCSQGMSGICTRGNASVGDNIIKLTRSDVNVNRMNSYGRAYFTEPVQLWDPSSRKLTDFITHFSFTISMDPHSPKKYGDGLAFFLSSSTPGEDPPLNSTGGYLGLFSDPNIVAAGNSTTKIVAIEFDSYQNSWDPEPDDDKIDHVGIDVNNISSVETVIWKSCIKDGRTANAWVSYNSTTFNLSVFLSYDKDPTFINGKSSLYYIVNLRKILPEKVSVGFSASTGNSVEIHSILSWSFNSTLELSNKTSKTWLAVGVTAGVVGVVLGLGLVLLLLKKRRANRKRKHNEKDMDGLDVSIDDEFEKGRGPRRFPYKELVRATKNFSDEGKLGEGGFGAVYRGFLSDLGVDVAIKRVSKGSRQGRKEYISEVNIISRLRHRNLVQLIGWCHDQGELLLVYEFMPNRSLDSHLFKGSIGGVLTWALRYKIAVGLASALLYLHEEWEQCVVHRDVKSSNVMLDSGFNAKLGDFGLARLVDHDRGSQTTVLAGTMGYMAPECVMTGRASKESDVYSFGVVALEIACGRGAVEPKAEFGQVSLVEWVWNLYGKGILLTAVDQRLEAAEGLDEQRQMERVMVVGLWCAHPDVNLRPSIRQAVMALNFEVAVPDLPAQLPVAMYFAPRLNMNHFLYTSGAKEGDAMTTTSTANSNVSTNTTSSYSSSTTSLLHSERKDVSMPR